MANWFGTAGAAADGAAQDPRAAASHHGLPLHRLSAHERRRVLFERGNSKANDFPSSRVSPSSAGLHGASRHFFCPHCVSWLFTRPGGMDWFVKLRPTMLDDPSWFFALRRNLDEREAAVGDDACGASLRDGAGFRRIREADTGIRRAGVVRQAGRAF
jgi:hypothetical protein